MIHNKWKATVFYTHRVTKTKAHVWTTCQQYYVKQFKRLYTITKCCDLQLLLLSTLARNSEYPVHILTYLRGRTYTILNRINISYMSILYFFLK